MGTKARGGQPIFQGVGGFLVTPSNTLRLVEDAGNTAKTDPYTTENYALHSNDGGDIVIVTVDGSELLWTVPAGGDVPMLVRQVLVSGTAGTTTATNIIAVKGN